MFTSSTYTYNDIFREGPAAYIILAPDAPRFTILDVNNSYLNVTRTERDNIIGKGMFEVFPGNPDNLLDETDLLKESLLTTIAQKEPNKMPMHRYDIFDEKKGGFVKRYWTGVNTPIIDQEGKINCIVHSPLDVTYTYELSKKEKEIVRALHHQRNELFSVFKHAPVGIGIFKGGDLQVELANDELCHLLGTTPAAITGKSIYEVLSGIAGENFLDLIKSSINTANPFVGYELPLKIVRDEGTREVHINFAYEHLKDIYGDTTGVIVVANDVSTQVLTRKKLEESEQRLNLAINASNLGIWDIDLETGKSVRSERHAEIFGHADHSVEWKIEDLFQDIFPEDVTKVKAEYAKSLESGFFNAQFRLGTSSNKFRWIQITGEAKKNTEGKVIRMLGTVADITQYKELEKLKDEFISTVSHEIKTPVTSIKAYGQLLQRKMFQEENYENVVFLKKMDTQINRLSSLVHHFLDATRIESNKILFKPVVFDLNKLAREIVEEIQQISPYHEIILSSCEFCQVYADIDRIRQVIVNLLNNAIKYSPKANTVEVYVYNADGQAQVCIKDFGIGISAEQQLKIFDRFYQAEDRGNTTPGLGLGLYISHEIITRHSGEMWLKSTPKIGSEFFFKLPLHHSDAE